MHALYFHSQPDLSFKRSSGASHENPPAITVTRSVPEMREFTQARSTSVKFANTVPRRHPSQCGIVPNSDRYGTLTTVHGDSSLIAHAVSRRPQQSRHRAKGHDSSRSGLNETRVETYAPTG